MVQRSGAGTLRLCILVLALVGGLVVPARAEKLTLGASAALTTDYVFRGISQTLQNPAVQGSLDANYGIFYLGAWGSSIDFGDAAPPLPPGNIASIEIDYYAGLRPEWRDISLDIGGIYYTYPGACDACLGGTPDYFELKTGASYTFFEAMTLGITNYWSPEFFGETGDADALELSGQYAFSRKLFNFFSPSVGGLVGWQWVEDGPDYSYWNLGLTLGFMDHWSADIRYWDSDFSDAGCAAWTGGYRTICDERVVGTLSASF